MTDEQPTWGAAAGKTWGEIAGNVNPRSDHQGPYGKQDDSDMRPPWVIEILNAQQAEIEVLKARVTELEAVLTPTMVERMLKFFRMKREAGKAQE